MGEKYKFSIKQVGKVRWIVDGLTQEDWAEIMATLVEVSDDPSDVSIKVDGVEMAYG